MSAENGRLLHRLAPICALLVAAVCQVTTMFSCDAAQGVNSKSIKWLFGGPAVAALAGNAEASRLLDGKEPFVMWGRQIPHVPSEWQAVQVRAFRNFAAIREALQSDALGPEVRGVMYDYERWQLTPEEEQRNPSPYVKQAAALVHAKNLLFFTAPAVNIVTVIAPSEDRTRLDDTYIRLGIASDAARYADVFDIQAQRFETDPSRYARFVRQAASQARQANPKVLVLAGISTEPIGQRVSADDILRAIAATRDVVDGYWFNIPQPSAYSPRAVEFRPDIAIDVLRRLDRG